MDHELSLLRGERRDESMRGRWEHATRREVARDNTRKRKQTITVKTRKQNIILRKRKRVKEKNTMLLFTRYAIMGCERSRKKCHTRLRILK